MSVAVSDATLGFDPLLFHESISTAIFCAATWVLMAVTAVPTYESYGQSWRAALVFTWSAALFTATTFYSVCGIGADAVAAGKAAPIRDTLENYDPNSRKRQDGLWRRKVKHRQEKVRRMKIFLLGRG